VALSHYCCRNGREIEEGVEEGWEWEEGEGETRKHTEGEV